MLELQVIFGWLTYELPENWEKFFALKFYELEVYEYFVQLMSLIFGICNEIFLVQNLDLPFSMFDYKGTGNNFF